VSDFGIYRNLKAAELVSSTQGNVANNAISIIQQTVSRATSFSLTAQANGVSNVAETLLAVMPFSAGLITANITTPSNIAANATDNLLVTVYARTAGVQRQVGQANLANVAVTQWIPLPLTIANAANAQVAAGDVLTYTITAGGSTVIPTGTIVDFVYADL
jgi:hypothetical protein